MLATLVPANWNLLYDYALGRELLDQMDRSLHGGIMQIVRLWADTHGLVEAGVVAWHAWGPLATAMVQGSWHGDVSPCFQRDAERDATWPPIVMSARLLRFFISLPCEDISRPHGGHARLAHHGSRVPPIPLCHVLKAARFAQYLKSQRLVGVTFAAARSMLLASASALAGTSTLPIRQTLQRHRVR